MCKKITNFDSIVHKFFFFYLFLKFHDFFSVKAMNYIKGQTFIISRVCPSYGIQNQVNILVFVMQVT